MQKRDLVSMFILVLGMCSTLSIMFLICLLASCTVAEERAFLEEAEIVIQAIEVLE